jgi:hypothetical protein
MTALAELQAAMKVFRVSRVGSTPAFDGAERLKACLQPDSRRSPARRGRQDLGQGRRWRREPTTSYGASIRL